MLSWRVLNLGDAWLADTALQRVKAGCQQVYADTPYCGPLAVFFRHESEGGLHCELKVYFSPEASVLAEQFGATACAQPARSGLGLLFGSAQAATVLFPESES
ncbi:hypothetical protein imdm_124 [gamma proteobacterium IMCC2047]|nr:hypothetical protein imdm_124 [gamma proteobacterium IMCC2047]